MTNDSRPPAVFYQTFRSGLYGLASLFALLGLFLVSGFSLQAPPPPVNPLQVVAGLALLFGAAYLAYSTVITRLTATPQGLAYRGLGANFTARWDQLVRIRVVKGRYGHHYALELADNLPRINLSQFGGDWDTSALGQYLRAYAPGLFTTLKPTSGKNSAAA